MSFKSLIAASLLVLTLLFASLTYLSAPAPAIAQNNTLDGRVKALEVSLTSLKQSNDALSVRVSALETAVATKTVVLVPTPIPATKSIKPVDPSKVNANYEIVKIEGKFVEAVGNFAKVSWLMTVKNNGNQRYIFNATVNFNDKDGFVVSEDYAYNLGLEPYETKTYNGILLVSLAASQTIAGTTVQTTVESAVDVPDAVEPSVAPTAQVTSTTVLTTASGAIPYVIDDDNADNRLKPLVITSERNGQGKLVVHCTLKPNQKLGDVWVVITPFGENDTMQGGMSALMNLHPDGNYEIHTDTNAKYDSVKWFRISWKGSDQ